MKLLVGIRRWENCILFLYKMGLEEDIKTTNKKIVNDFPNMARDRSWKCLKNAAMEGEEKIDYITSILCKESTKRVLEVGCGKGVALNSLTQEYPLIQFEGIDLIAEEAAGFKNVKLHSMDAHYLQFESNFFDLAFSFFTFAYLTDKIKALKEVYRVLKPKGQALIHLNPIYFYPNGKELIPSNPNESDIYWDKEFKHIIITKEGKSTSCLEQPYVGIYHTKLVRDYQNPVLSLYSPLPKEELEKIKVQEIKENAEWLFPIHNFLTEE